VVLLYLHMLCVCVRLCSQAEGSWSKERCCAFQGNDCRISSYCRDYTASSDYLYRLSPGEPERYETIPGGYAEYQRVYPTWWPNFGSGADLSIGTGAAGGPPGGNYADCQQGYTYRGSTNAACGGSNWGHTDLEVWFI
jgi:hypothetical protein